MSIDGYVVHVKNEPDSDLHVVLADAAGYTMVIEFPAPACMKGSRVFAQASAARKQLLRLVGNALVP